MGRKTCERSDSPALSAFLDGALPDEEQLWLARHIDGCAACAAALAALRELDAALIDAVAPDLGVDPGEAYWEGFARQVAEKTLSQVSEAGPPPPARPGVWSFALGALSAVAAMWLLVVLYGSSLVSALPAGGSPGALPGSELVAMRRRVGELRRELVETRRLVTQPAVHALGQNVRAYRKAQEIAVDAQVTDPLLDAVEVALIQLDCTRSREELLTLQDSLAASRLTERLRAAGKASRDSRERRLLGEVTETLERVAGAPAGAWRAADVTVLRRRAGVARLQEQLATLRGNTAIHDNIREVNLESR